MGCGNGSERTPHPLELLGEDWYVWGDWGISAPPGERRAKISQA
jgi:hypothetical protein